MCAEAALVRADLHAFKGNTKRQAREMRELLQTAESALNNGRTEVAAQRIAAAMRILKAQLDS
jgi:hypothetical protein